MAPPMIGDNRMIMVIDGADHRGLQLKELIEFMDAPNVCTADPGEWRVRAGDARIEAVFVGPDLSDRDIRALVDDIGSLDPNIPIVMIKDPEGS